MDPAKQTPEPVNDSPAWNKDAHAEGAKYFEEHRAEQGAASGVVLKQLALDLFSNTQRLFALQTELRTLLGIEKARPWTTADLGAVNQWLAAQDWNTQRAQVSGSQMVLLWHLLVNQDDLQLLKPTESGPLRGW